ncbi:MAG: inorganic phosphate transporter [Verrucomicrobia bacterium]|nr:inorganic phosphate transporter [Verrucomicrobiota bacterium]
MVLLVVLAFEYINGFHDTANAIATVVSTKVLTPRQALLLASGTNLIGAFCGQEVAKTMHSGLIDDKVVAVTTLTILCAMLGGIIWNLITWWFGMPSSSSHALIGGLIGAAMASTPGSWNWHVLIWSRMKMDSKTSLPTGDMEGIFHKVVIPMISSPMLGMTIGFILMGLLFAILSHWKPKITCPTAGLIGGILGWNIPMVVLAAAFYALKLFGKIVPSLAAMSESVGTLHAPPSVKMICAGLGFVSLTWMSWHMGFWTPAKINTVFSKLQVWSAGYMGFGHGLADAQKTMGIIMLTLFASTKAGELDNLPTWLQFLRITDKSANIPLWIMITCAATMAAGTYAGGWRIIKTLGHKMVKMKPVHGFAAETTAATILAVTGSLGMPVSTTHTITTSIMGVGAARRWNAIEWSLVERIVWAWVMTIPVTATLAYVIYKFLALFA